MHTPGRYVSTFSLLAVAGFSSACAPQPAAFGLRATPSDLDVGGMSRVETGPARDVVYTPRGEIPASESARYARIEELLADRVPLLDVRQHSYGRFSLQVRGRSSLDGDRAPLIVVDGMQFVENGADALSAIAPRDVRRVEVLRDASTTAVYGPRGANGVVLVSTRHAR